MQRRLIIGLSLALTMVPLSVWAQGMSEFGAVQAGAAGLGAGLAASQNHGALVRNGYEAAVQAQGAMFVQNRAIQQYLAAGQAFEAKKQWANAEMAFTYVLQVICKRDGPGSPATVPALKHLVAVSKGQNKIDKAIGFQKTVVAFAHAAPKPDTASLLSAERDLSDMYVKKGDFASAEPVLQDAVKIQDKVPKLTPEQRSATLKVYGRVLRELNKIREADEVDALAILGGSGAAISAAGAGHLHAATVGAVAPGIDSAVAPNVHGATQAGAQVDAVHVGASPAMETSRADTVTAIPPTAAGGLAPSDLAPAPVSATRPAPATASVPVSVLAPAAASAPASVSIPVSISGSTPASTNITSTQSTQSAPNVSNTSAEPAAQAGVASTTAVGSGTAAGMITGNSKDFSPQAPVPVSDGKPGEKTTLPDASDKAPTNSNKNRIQSQAQPQPTPAKGPSAQSQKSDSSTMPAGKAN
jgi:hypothetical protein